MESKPHRSGDLDGGGRAPLGNPVKLRDHTSLAIAELLSVITGVISVIASFLTLRSFGEVTKARSLESAVVVTASLVGVVIVFALVIRWFRDRSARLRVTRESLVSSYLAALDRTSLNPEGPSFQIAVRSQRE